jgi:hypothetical protein
MLIYTAWKFPGGIILYLKLFTIVCVDIIKVSIIRSRSCGENYSVTKTLPPV